MVRDLAFLAVTEGTGLLRTAEYLPTVRRSYPKKDRELVSSPCIIEE